jgi:hypothetical protein
MCMISIISNRLGRRINIASFKGRIYTDAKGSTKILIGRQAERILRAQIGDRE